MYPKVLITGGTGYIGGTVLDTIANTHPQYDLTALLRRVPDGFEEQYPSISVVKGDYDSEDVLRDAASKADVVVHCGNSDHEPSIQALIAGLVSRSGPETKPGFFIHLSGTGIVSDWLSDHEPGTLNSQVWSDVVDLDAIASLPANALHRNVDAIIQAAAAEHGDKLKTAIVRPPDIYGPGRGPGRKQSAFFPMFLREVNGIGRPFYVAKGANKRSWVHIDDLMSVYLSLVEAAVEGGGKADWGREGYYFASTQEADQHSIATAFGKIMAKHGLLSTEAAEPKQLPAADVDHMISIAGYDAPLGRYMFASNSRTVPDRAKRLFQYQAKHPNVFESMEADVLAAVSPGEWEGLNMRRKEW